MIKKIKVNGCECNYIIDPLRTDFKSFEFGIFGVNAHEALLLNQINGVRMVITPPLSFGQEHYFEYLCWITSKDLKELDKKVINDTYNDVDFEDSFKTYFKQKIICTNCGNQYRGFSVDQTMPYN